MVPSVIDFSFDGQGVRVVMVDGEPWWVAKDVCDVLEISNPSDALKRLEEGDLDSTEVIDALGRPQSTNIVSESGLYDLVLGSRKPEARAFKRWITREVLPSIRKHGLYAKDELLDNPDLLIEVATRLRDERRARLEAEARLARQEPLVNFAQNIMTSTDSLLVREVAKLAKKNGIEIGQNRLYKRLRAWGLIMMDSCEPTQRGMDSDHFEVIERPVGEGDDTRLRLTTKVTPKGQVYIINRLLRERGGRGAELA